MSVCGVHGSTVHSHIINISSTVSNDLTPYYKYDTCSLRYQFFLLTGRWLSWPESITEWPLPKEIACRKMKQPRDTDPTLFGLRVLVPGAMRPSTIETTQDVLLLQLAIMAIIYYNVVIAVCTRRMESEWFARKTYKLGTLGTRRCISLQSAEVRSSIATTLSASRQRGTACQTWFRMLGLLGHTI